MRSSLIMILVSLLLACSKNENDNSEPVAKPPMFSQLDGSQTNLKFKNIIPENERMNSWTYEYYYNGGGVSVGDVNNDDLPDVYLTGNVTPNRLYLNLGNFKFQDITNSAGLKDSPSWTTGTTMVDINNDDILDIYVCRSGKLEDDQRRNLFYISNGMKNGLPTYTNQAKTLGLDDPAYSTQATFFDYDRDGDLDMYLLNHNVEVKPYFEVENLKKRRDSLVGDKLFRNDGKTFKDVSIDAGIIGNEIGYGLGVSIGDLNNDGWPDIYVANDYSEHDYLYINKQNGTFAEQSTKSLKHMSNFAMGTDIADINNDGLLDIMTLDMVAEDNYGIKTSMSGMSPERFQTHLDNGLQHQYMYNTLQINRGDNQFSEIAQLAGVHSTDWSWAPLFLDIDLDGQKDLFVTNGLKRDFRNNDYRNYKIKRLEAVEGNENVNKSALIKELVAMTPQKKIVNYVFQNQGNLQFKNRQKDWGITSATYSNGLAYADFDNDGDLDLIANNIDEEPTIYKNNARELSENNYLKILFNGPVQNKGGIGTKVKLWTGLTMQIQEHYLTRGYQSSVSRGLTFGVGPADKIDSLEVIWPDGNIQNLNPIESNQTITIKYAESAPNKKKTPGKMAIVDLTKKYGLNYSHQEVAFNDFERESLLPHKMSELGPGLAVADVNKDGMEDVFVGGAKGFSGKLFLQSKNKTFESSKSRPWNQYSQSEDMSAVFFDANGDAWLDLYVVSGSNEYVQGDRNLKDHLYLNVEGQFVDASDRLPEIFVSGFSVEPQDFDQDGDMDLFIGGRQVPGQYPESASSFLLENKGENFEDVTEQMGPGLRNLGMVTDAIWSDYNKDGSMDLIVVGEWMKMTVFENRSGQFVRTEPSGTERSTGWWYSISAADFDHDGDADYVLGNNGLNYKYKASETEPFSIYASDFDDNGTRDIVLGYYDNNKEFPLRGRECSSNQMPFIKEKFPTYHDFGSASLEEVYDMENLQQALQYHVQTFATSFVENKGKAGFQFSSLSEWSQLSSVNKILIRDINSDGHLDLIMAGNMYQSEVETPRNDASYGVILIGDGSGGFEYASHLNLGEDVKDMVMIRLVDGTEAIVVAVNNGPLKLISINN